MTGLVSRIKQEARALGFDVAGVTVPAAVAKAGGRLQEFLRLGRHGTMQWMESRATARAHPRALWPDARSVIVCGMNYGPARDPLEALECGSHGAISVYAQGSDYHDICQKAFETPCPVAVRMRKL